MNGEAGGEGPVSRVRVQSHGSEVEEVPLRSKVRVLRPESRARVSKPWFRGRRSTDEGLARVQSPETRLWEQGQDGAWE